jgi:ech hydrogenase subunit A
VDIFALLMLFPLLTAVLLQIFRNERLQGWITRISAFAIIGISLMFVGLNFGKDFSISLESEWLNYLILLLDAGMALLIISMSLKHKKILPILLTLLQTPLLIWFELSKSHGIEIKANIKADNLSMIMVLIIGIVGSIICIYTVTYMKEYHHHHKEYKNRTTFFLTIVFLFLSAMFGIVLSNNLMWMYFFWEVTTLCSFLLIGYTKTEEAIRNAFKALVMNLFGGVAFAVAIVYIALNLNTIEMSGFLSATANSSLLFIPVVLLSLAGLTKAAQMPFSNWLLGAMVAPTPSSALLHSSTMVKAGVFMIIRLAPLLMGNIAGTMVILIGGITFMIGALAAISQTDAKRLLAWSTISNLGLIVACGGIGTYEAVWAGILLIIFHAVSKSLLFLSVGSVDNITGSRDIEDMHGMIVKIPEMAIFLTIGIAGMFLAPFGMLISKWAALRAFIDSRNVLIIMALVFGSSATLFYWTKWLGKLVAILNRSEKLVYKIKNDEWTSLSLISILTVITCFTFPLISSDVIEPYLKAIYGPQIHGILSPGNISIMMFMLALVLFMPIGMTLFAHNTEDKIVTSYMGGVNTGDSRGFVNSFGKPQDIYLSNWYMDKYLNEKLLTTVGIIISAATLAVIVLMAVGGAL